MTRNRLLGGTAPRDPAVRGHAAPAVEHPGPVLVWAAAGRSWQVFVRQVLGRPLRIGLLALLGASVAAVVVGANSWWIVLGVVLFQAAASALVALWLEVDQEPGEQRTGEQRTGEPEPDEPEPDEPEPDGDGRRGPDREPGPDVPGQREPDPDE